MNDIHSENLLMPLHEGEPEETNSCDKHTSTQEGTDPITTENQDTSNDKALINVADVPLQSHDSEYHLTSEHQIESDFTKSSDTVNISNSSSDAKVVPKFTSLPSTSDSQPDLLYHTPRSSNKLSSTDSEESIKTFNASTLRKKRPKSDTIISKVIIDKSKKNGILRSKHSSPSGK